MAIAIPKAPKLLRNSVLQDFYIFRTKIGNQFLVFVPRDEIDQDLLGGRMYDDLRIARRLTLLSNARGDCEHGKNGDGAERHSASYWRVYGSAMF
jgi:hypothetical protein